MSECANRIERIVLELLRSLLNGNASLRIPRTTPTTANAADRRVSYNHRSSRHTFCLLVYLLARTHSLQVHGGSYTVRGLYYGDPELILSQNRMARARLDVCRMLGTSPTHLGVLAASKGLIAGELGTRLMGLLTAGYSFQATSSS